MQLTYIYEIAFVVSSSFSHYGFQNIIRKEDDSSCKGKVLLYCFHCNLLHLFLGPLVRTLKQRERKSHPDAYWNVIQMKGSAIKNPSRRTAMSWNSDNYRTNYFFRPFENPETTIHFLTNKQDDVKQDG